jgi:hypothetical protein
MHVITFIPLTKMPVHGLASQINFPISRSQRERVDMPRRLRGGTWRRRGPSLLGGGTRLCPTEILGEMKCPFAILCLLKTLSQHLPFLRQRTSSSRARARALLMARSLDAWWPTFFAHFPENLPRFVGAGTDGCLPLGASKGHVRLSFEDYWKAWLWRSGVDADMRVMCEAWLLLFDAFLEELSEAEWPKSTQQLLKLQELAKKIQEGIDLMSLYCGTLGFWQVVVAAAIGPVDSVAEVRKHYALQYARRV